MDGFSYRNLAMCRQFYPFYSSTNLQQAVADFQVSENRFNGEHSRSETETIQQGVFQLLNNNENNRKALALQIPWGHNVLIFSKSKLITQAFI